MLRLTRSENVLLVLLELLLEDLMPKSELRRLVRVLVVVEEPVVSASPAWPGNAAVAQRATARAAIRSGWRTEERAEERFILRKLKPQLFTASSIAVYARRSPMARVWFGAGVSMLRTLVSPRPGSHKNHV